MKNVSDMKTNYELYCRYRDALIDAETDTACNFQTLTAETLGGIYDLEFKMADETPHLFYDYYSRSFFKSTISHVLQAEYHLNRNYALRLFCPVNEWYEFLGLAVGFEDDRIGWSATSGIGWLDFKHPRHRTRSGLEYYQIIFSVDPEIMEDV